MTDTTHFDKTHRCPASLSAEASIRHHTQRTDISYDYTKTGWYHGALDIDNDWASWYMSYGIAPIFYCPYCGKKLDD